MAVRGARLMRRWALTIRALAASLSVAGQLTLAPSGGAAPPPQASPAPGTVFALAGTNHLWFADEQGVLHWGGDTRALAGKSINWGTRSELSLQQLLAYRRGDPWLSAGLLKIGDPIYFVKWETVEARPRLQYILSIRDVELFGIDESNYGRYVKELAAWEREFGFDAATLSKEVLPPATTQPGPTVLFRDTMDNPETGLLPRESRAPTSYEQGYRDGEYVFRRIDPGSPTSLSFSFSGAYVDGSVGIDLRMGSGLGASGLMLFCRQQGASSLYRYSMSYFPSSATVGLYRQDGVDASRRSLITVLVPQRSDAAIRPVTEGNRLELRCVGPAIEVRVNGALVVSTSDATYPGAGRWSFQYLPPTTIASDAWLDDLVLSRE